MCPIRESLNNRSRIIAETRKVRINYRILRNRYLLSGEKTLILDLSQHTQGISAERNPPIQ
jgi:hypothetical protein